MALGPISSLGAAPAPPISPSRDVTNAQRAFFQAALGQAAPVAAVAAPVAPRAQAPEPPKAEATRAEATAEAPKTAYRPGSLLDVRI